jgi:hypothetical protein
MLHMKKNILFALMIAAAGFVGCTKSDVAGNPENGKGIAPGGCFPPINCTDIICTAQFADIPLEVRDNAGTAVVLDSFVVTNGAGVPIPSVNGIPAYGYPQSGTDGVYSVMNDSWVQGHQNSSIQVIAKGYRNGLQVFREPFTIMADCCHVSKQSGKDVVIIP